MIQSEAELIRPQGRGQLKHRGGSAQHWVAKVRKRCQSICIESIILTLGGIRLSESCIWDLLSILGIDNSHFRSSRNMLWGTVRGTLLVFRLNVT